MRRLLIGLLAGTTGLALVSLATDAPEPVAEVAAAEPAGRVAADPAPALPAGRSALPAPASRAGADEQLASARLRHEQDQAYWHQRLRGYQDSGGNLQQFFSELLSQCGREPDLCQALLEDRLAGYPDAAFASQLRTMLQQHYGYEAAMQAVRMNTGLPPQSRYQQLDAMRVQHFGEAATELLFGQERAWADYQFRYGELLDQAPSLSTDQRLQSLAQLRSEAWGAYDSALASEEGRYGRYRRERELLLVGITDADERERIDQALLAQYFDADEASRIAGREQARQQQEQQQRQYDSARQALDQDMAALRASLPPAQWQQLYQQRLGELRQQLFQ